MAPADNLAQYVLAKWAQSQIGEYPPLPVAEGEPNQDPQDRRGLVALVDGQLTITDNNLLNQALKGPLTANADDVDSTCDDDDEAGGCAPGDPIVITQLSNSSASISIASNISDLQPEFDSAPIAPYTLPSNPSLTCLKSEIIEGQPSVSSDVVNSNIKNFCSVSAGKTLTPAPIGAIFYTYPVSSNKNDVVWLGAQVNLGDPQCQDTSKIDEKDCLAEFAITVDQCDSDSKTNKYGGIIVNDCVVWSFGVDPNGQNPYPSKSSPQPSAPVAVSQLSDSQPQATPSPSTKDSKPDPPPASHLPPKPTPKDPPPPPPPKPKGPCKDGLSNIDKGYCEENCVGGDCATYTNPFGNDPPWYVCNC